MFGWTATEAASFTVLDALVDAGLNFIDTADVYSVWVPGHRGGESETVIGNWLKRRRRRKDVVIATKVGMQMAPDRKGLSAASYRTLGRGFAAKTADRSHRSVLFPLRRCQPYPSRRRSAPIKS